MPTISIFGIACRVRPLLDAIGAQEALEHCGTQQPMPSASAKAHSRWDRKRQALALRRNAAERRLRHMPPNDEHEAWCQWRRSPPDVRAAVYAVLTDLPGRHMPDAPAAAPPAAE
jgi:hypothetical protein